MNLNNLNIGDVIFVYEKSYNSYKIFSIKITKVTAKTIYYETLTKENFADFNYGTQISKYKLFDAYETVKDCRKAIFEDIEKDINTLRQDLHRLESLKGQYKK